MTLRLAELVARPRPRHIVTLLLTAALLSGCGDDDSGSSSGGASDASSPSTEPRTEEPESDAEPESDSEPDAEPEPSTEPGTDERPPDRPPIFVVTPEPFTTIVRGDRMALTGTANVSEGTLAWEVLDAAKRPMSSGRMTATCGAPCDDGRFRTIIDSRTLPIGSWELRVWAPNTDDAGPPRLFEVVVPITIAVSETPGAPPPGTLPPGGAPQEPPVAAPGG